MNIVLVEDDGLLARHFQRVLIAAGYDVYTTQHAPGAIDLIDDKQPEAIVLDMLLSGSTAMNLLHELQSHEDLAMIPVVVATNLATEGLSEQLEPYGVQRILDKSTMEPDDLAAAVRSVTE